MPELKRPIPSKRNSLDYDGMIPGEDNRTDSDLGQMTDAISDRLEYALPRTGLTPSLKLMMARLPFRRRPAWNSRTGAADPRSGPAHAPLPLTLSRRGHLSGIQFNSAEPP
jgi:hypothetical protein